MLKKYAVLIVFVFGFLQTWNLEADRHLVVVPRLRPRLMIVEKYSSSNYADGFFMGMLFERILQSHPIVTLTAATAFTAACIYAALSSASNNKVESTVVYMEDEVDEDEVVYVIHT